MLMLAACQLKVLTSYKQQVIANIRMLDAVRVEVVGSLMA
jgi:hypothetical protein